MFLSFNFGKALELLREGKRVQREAWVQTGGDFLELERSNGVELVHLWRHSRGVDHLLGVHRTRVDWLPSQVDILATDWIEVFS
jgi:hypothetical protein